jgi:hypothetical protein
MKGSNVRPNLRYYIGIFLEGMRKTTENLTRATASLGLCFKPGPPDYETADPTIRLRWIHTSAIGGDVKTNGMSSPPPRQMIFVTQVTCLEDKILNKGTLSHAATAFRCPWKSNQGELKLNCNKSLLQHNEMEFDEKTAHFINQTSFLTAQPRPLVEAVAYLSDDSGLTGSKDR